MENCSLLAEDKRHPNKMFINEEKKHSNIYHFGSMKTTWYLPAMHSLNWGYLIIPPDPIILGTQSSN